MNVKVRSDLMAPTILMFVFAFFSFASAVVFVLQLDQTKPRAIAGAAAPVFVDTFPQRYIAAPILIVAGIFFIGVGLLIRRFVHRFTFTPPTMSASELTAVLQQTLKFTDADLQANRIGQFSDSQRQTFEKFSRHKNDLPSLQVVEGQVKLYITRQPSRIGPAWFDYKMMIGGITFFMDENNIKAFWNGAHYRIYYTPNAKTMTRTIPDFLSAELIGDPANPG